MFLFLTIIAMIVWCCIIYFLIRAANDTAKRDKIQLQNQKLLALIAEKNGVDSERIVSVLKS